ncbi:MAG: hypothetical protein LBT56_01495 [Prevotellaceae bacterium]|jgi:hypothetical protein|nr:hypothetical protein [Prevotellaceae bacterium]
MDIKEILEQKTDKELTAITGEDRFKYVDEIVFVAEQILMERNVLTFAPENKNVVELHKQEAKKTKKETKLTGFAVAPLVVGLIFASLAFVEIPINLSYDDTLIVMVLINIVVRIIVLIWIYTEINRYNIKYQFIWMLLGLVFGGWALVVFSFALSYRPIPEDDDDDNYYPADEDNYSNYIETESDTE